MLPTFHHVTQETSPDGDVTGNRAVVYLTPMDAVRLRAYVGDDGKVNSAQVYVGTTGCRVFNIEPTTGSYLDC